MSDLIDREALDRAFTQLRFDSNGELAHWGDRKDWCLLGSEVEKLIADAPTIQAPRWVRCDERLPDRPDAYAVGWRYLNGCFYWGKVLFFNDKWQVDDEIPMPDYWMPIEPPKEGSDGE